jgi:hypothetical protein
MNTAPEDMYFNPDVEKGLEQWLSPYWFTDTVYLMSDIKKSGLTFNRNIHNLLIKCCKKVYPEFNWEPYFNYGNAKIVIGDNDPVPMKNGYGLGMLDCVISFTQACIYQIIIYKGLTEGYTSEAKFWSDDMVVRLKSKTKSDVDLEVVDNLLQEYDSYASKCGIRVHEKKPYVSFQGVFLESYGTSFKAPWDSVKTCQWLGCLFDCLKCPTICRAKEVFATICLEVPENLYVWLSTILGDIVDFWGYEFSKTEYTYPYELGGWMYNIKDGYNDLFWWLDEQEDEKFLPKIIRVAILSEKRMNTLKFHKDNKDYIDGILSRGWDRDPTKLSWRKIARTSLYTNYKGKSQQFPLEVKYEKRRQEVYKEKTMETLLGLTQDLWESVKESSWYLPPLFCLSLGVENSYVGRDYECEDFRPYNIDTMRCWLAITRYKGSVVQVTDPNIDYKKYHPSDLASILLYNETGGKMCLAEDVIFALQYGYDYKELSKAVSNRVGDHKFKVTPETSTLYEVFKELIGTRGEFIYPMYTLRRAVFTDFEGSIGFGLTDPVEYDSYAIYKACDQFSKSGFSFFEMRDLLKEHFQEEKEIQRHDVKTHNLQSDPEEYVPASGIGLDVLQSYMASIIRALNPLTAEQREQGLIEEAPDPTLAVGYDDVSNNLFGDAPDGDY